MRTSKALRATAEFYTHKKQEIETQCCVHTRLKLYIFVWGAKKKHEILVVLVASSLRI